MPEQSRPDTPRRTLPGFSVRRPRHPALDFPPFDETAQKGRFDPYVFGVAALLAIGFVVWGALDTDGLFSSSNAAVDWVVQNTGWVFILASSGFVVFVLWLALGKFGNIPLGRDDEMPEFRTSSWIAMMFSAGMGIGLMFWGAAEPLGHFTNGVPGTDPDRAVETAMAQTLFHWTLHPWAIYCVVGLAVAYGMYRKGRVQLISSIFGPLLGRHAEGPIGRAIDMLAIFATLFGSAASLGLGALQIAEGYQVIGGAGEVTNTLLVTLIVVLTICFILSAVSGISRGIQLLSNINMVLALTLAVFVFVVGPTVFMLNMIPASIGEYVQQLGIMAGRTGVEGEEVAGWMRGWTVFYWAWWISWTPFVGMFIARISRGRTIRQFVTGVLLVPSAVSLVWFAVFGGAAIFEARSGKDLGDGATSQLFGLLEQYPISTVTSLLVMLLVSIFFVSGADAASIVMGSLSEHGAMEPKRINVVFWGSLTGAVAAILLVIGNNAQGGVKGESNSALQGLQNVTIVAALPFVLVMIGVCVALVQDLRKDPLVVRLAYARERVEAAVVAGVTEHGDDFSLAVVFDDTATNLVPIDDDLLPPIDPASAVKADAGSGNPTESAADPGPGIGSGGVSDNEPGGKHRDGPTS